MPGSGKTFLVGHALFHAVCKGMNAMITSLSSERAMQFAGMHIHDLFGLPVSNNAQDMVNDLVEKSLRKLMHDPNKLRLFKRIDVLYFEEIGMICAEEFAAIDVILQKCHDCDLPFGGPLVFATGDPKQLHHQKVV